MAKYSEIQVNLVELLVYLNVRLEKRAPNNKVTAESSVFVIVSTKHFAVLVFTRALLHMDTRRLQSRFLSSESKSLQSKSCSCAALLSTGRID